jgi:hypothetical protein
VRLRSSANSPWRCVWSHTSKRELAFLVKNCPNYCLNYLVLRGIWFIKARGYDSSHFSMFWGIWFVPTRFLVFIHVNTMADTIETISRQCQGVVFVEKRLDRHVLVCRYRTCRWRIWSVALTIVGYWILWKWMVESSPIVETEISNIGLTQKAKL